MFDKYISKSLLTTLLCLSFIIGIYLGPNLTPFAFYSILIIISASIIFYIRKSKLTYFTTIILGILIGSITINHTIFKIQNYQLLKYDTTQTITGDILYPPEIKNNKQQIVLTNLKDEKHNNYDGNLLVFASPFPPYQYTNQIQVKAKIKKPENFSADFSYIGYLSLKNIHYTAYYPRIILQSENKYTSPISQITEENITSVNTSNSLPKSGGKIEGRGGITIFFKYLYQFRDLILDQINRTLPYPQSGLLAGLLLGYKNALPQNLYDQFRIAGLTHIIVVSGFNLSVFATLLLKNIRGQLPRLFLLILTLLIILIFTLLTGAESSIVRAFFMSCILLTAPFLSRRNHPTIAILLAACIMIYLNPFILWYDAGFHLSFLATFGLIYISPILSPVFQKLFLPSFIQSTLAETLSAMIPTTPYIAASFHQISLIALISNILVLPIIPFTMGIGAINILLSAIPQISTPINLITNTLLSYIILIGEKLSQIPYSSIPIEIPKQWLIFFYILITTFILFSKYLNNTKPSH